MNYKIPGTPLPPSPSVGAGSINRELAKIARAKKISRLWINGKVYNVREYEKTMLRKGKESIR